jgi:hypothetical protein
MVRLLGDSQTTKGLNHGAGPKSPAFIWAFFWVSL